MSVFVETELSGHFILEEMCWVKFNSVPKDMLFGGKTKSIIKL